MLECYVTYAESAFFDSKGGCNYLVLHANAAVFCMTVHSAVE